MTRVVLFLEVDTQSGKADKQLVHLFEHVNSMHFHMHGLFCELEVG